jgi:hypothetical protein
MLEVTTGGHGILEANAGAHARQWMLFETEVTKPRVWCALPRWLYTLTPSSSGRWLGYMDGQWACPHGIVWEAYLVMA